MDLQTFGTIATAIAAVLGIGGATRIVWRKTLGRRRHFKRAVRRLGTNAQHDYFIKQLESPPAIREAHDGFARLVWVDADFLVCAIVGPSGSVEGYSITTRTRRFRPSFVVPGSGSRERRWLGAIVERLPWDLRSRLFRWHFPPFKVRLGRTRFASLSDTPNHLSSWIGARSFQYEEVHYYGNPGNYLNYVFAVTDSGPMVADAIEDLFYPDGPHAGEITWNAPVGAVLDDDVPGIGAFRYRARMNSIAFVSWEPDDVKSVVLFVRRDEVRTFA